MNTFVMFLLRVNSFAASLPRIEGYMVLFLFFSFAVSSTMETPLLDHLVRDRESIQSLFSKTFFWIRFQPRSVRRCSESLLDSNREDIENIALLVLFRHNSNNSTLSISRNHCFRIVAEWVVDVILLQVCLKCFSMMTRDLLHELSERGNYLLLSQLHVAILTL